MKTQVLTAVALAMAMAIALAGCADSSDPAVTSEVGIDDYDQIDMNAEYGGLTATDEDDAFGDPSLMMAGLDDDADEVNDPLLEDPAIAEQVAALRAAGQQPGDPSDPDRPRFTFLRVKWGMLRGSADSSGNDNDDVGALLDWTGQIRVDRGIVIIRRVIRFERPFDHIVRPRLDPQTVAFISHTGPHFDGLVLEIIEPPPGEQDDPVEPNYLRFETGPLTQTFLVAELPELDEVFEVAPVGNGVHFNGFSLAELNACPVGFLSGRWAPLTPEEAAIDMNGVRGRFRGRWLARHGHLRGYMRGAYGINAEGTRVFFGKYIDRLGRFRGFLRGTWEPSAEENSWASFHGEWATASGQIDGFLRGRAYHLPVTPGGFYEGRWATDCGDNDALMQ